MDAEAWNVAGVEQEPRVLFYLGWRACLAWLEDEAEMDRHLHDGFQCKSSTELGRGMNQKIVDVSEDQTAWGAIRA